MCQLSLALTHPWLGVSASHNKVIKCSLLNSDSDSWASAMTSTFDSQARAFHLRSIAVERAKWKVCNTAASYVKF